MITPSWSYAKRMVAGAVFGLYMAHLLYFLNPQIEIRALPLAGITAVYVVLAGLIFGSLLWLLRIGRIRLFGPPHPTHYRPHGFGFVVTAAFVSALVYWGHLVLLRIYLPRGAVRILSKATTIIAVTAAVLFVIWLFERNASRRTSRALFVTGVILVVVSSVFLYQRREGYVGETRREITTTIAEREPRAQLLVVLRDVPHDWLLTLRAEGAIPFLGTLMDEGFVTRIEPFRTTSPKALRASLNTGKLPSRHGVTGRFSYRTALNRDEPYLLVPMGVGFKGWGLIPPVERISAALPAGSSIPFWRIYERAGVPATVLGWEGGPGAEGDLHGDRAAQRDAEQLLAGSGSTARRAELSRELARDLAAIRAAAAADREPRMIAVELTSASAAQRALELSDNRLPPRHTPEGEVLRSLLTALDRALSQLAPHDGILAIASPSAAYPPALPATLSGVARAFEESQDPGVDDGFLILHGRATVRQQASAPAEVVDLVPTLLFAGGLPIGRDMDGRVLTEAFREDFLRTHAISLIHTWEASRLEVRPATSPATQGSPQVPEPRS